MDITNQLLEIDCLIFSSHKTGTQTIKRSLMSSGVKCLHCHGLRNINLQANQFHEYLNYYNEVACRKLKIISIFRDPLERIMSSFFQSLTEDPYAWVGQDNAKETDGDTENIVRGMSFHDLQSLFYRYCERIDGYGESVLIICQELGIDPEKLTFSGQRLIGENDFDTCSLYLLRFDLMLPQLSDLLSHIMGRQISVRPSNLGSSKWYAEIYTGFKEHLRMTSDDIERIYKSRESLIELFYPGQYNSILSGKIRQYGSQNC
jgi:hypothetical protein